MPLALLIVGILIVVAGVKNNATQLEQTLVSDFSGAGSFWYWIVAVIVIGAIGYYRPAKTVSHLFLGLIVLVFLLSNGGVFAKIQEAIQNPSPAPATPEASPSGSDGKIAGVTGTDFMSNPSGAASTMIGNILKGVIPSPAPDNTGSSSSGSSGGGNSGGGGGGF